MTLVPGCTVLHRVLISLAIFWWLICFYDQNYSLFYPNSCTIIAIKKSPCVAYAWNWSWCVSVCGILYKWAAKQRRINCQIRETLCRPHATSWLVHTVADEGRLSIIGPVTPAMVWSVTFDLELFERRCVLFIFYAFLCCDFVRFI